VNFSDNSVSPGYFLGRGPYPPRHSLSIWPHFTFAVIRRWGRVP
jgi:hypothetical protein